jgi:lipopolysaccharide/colanic/teichoic acid biosynthesis glycosyltransferase
VNKEFEPPKIRPNENTECVLYPNETRAMGDSVGIHPVRKEAGYRDFSPTRAESSVFKHVYPFSRTKRIFDLGLAGLGLLGSLPFWGIVAVCIKVEDGGPIFYDQKRVGLRGRTFRSWKFRSMVPDSDERFGPLQAAENDNRITNVGRILRATALDELPQLWNILIGDMSFVGPRALVPEEIEVNGSGKVIRIEEIPGYEVRHQVPPGLTGMAQVHAPRDVLRRQKFVYDLLYIKKQNFWLDLKLIALSFWITFRGKWENREKKF